MLTTSRLKEKGKIVGISSKTNLIENFAWCFSSSDSHDTWLLIWWLLFVVRQKMRVQFCTTKEWKKTCLFCTYVRTGWSMCACTHYGRFFSFVVARPLYVVSSCRTFYWRGNSILDPRSAEGNLVGLEKCVWRTYGERFFIDGFSLHRYMYPNYYVPLSKITANANR